MPLDGCRRFGAIEFERHDNHEKTIQLYPGTVRVREAFVLRSIEVYPWFNDLVTASSGIAHEKVRALGARALGARALGAVVVRGVRRWPWRSDGPPPPGL